MIATLLPLLLGWTLDLVLGDPAGWPHPVVWMGRLIGWGERRLNHGLHRRAKGGLLAVGCIILAFAVGWALVCLPFWLPLPQTAQGACYIVLASIAIFYCLAGTTLRREVRATLAAVNHSLAEGRRQVGRIVGRDTSDLSAQQVRQAALETLAENMSDGVVAPLFWFVLLGIPGMLAHKMVNTLDSMIAYRTTRYRQFGYLAARIDDVANYLPARLTALIMALLARLLWRRRGVWQFTRFYAHCHTSPNSGWPEAALAGMLDCQFGGPHTYFGEYSPKPYIGHNPRLLTDKDGETALSLALATEVAAILLVVVAYAVPFLIR